MMENTTKEIKGGMAIVTLGLSDVADKLGPAVDEATKRIQSKS